MVFFTRKLSGLDILAFCTFFCLDEHKIKDAILNAHDGPIFAFLSLPNNCVLSGGQKDLLVSMYDLGILAKVRDVTVVSTRNPTPIRQNTTISTLIDCCFMLAP